MKCRLEILEAATCTLLSCNIAWHNQAALAEVTGARHDGNSSSVGGLSTYSSLSSAVQHAMAALHAVQPPAVPAAPAFQVHTLSHLIQLCYTPLSLNLLGTDTSHCMQGHNMAF